jgi:hypothetical protein
MGKEVLIGGSMGTFGLFGVVGEDRKSGSDFFCD